MSKASFYQIPVKERKVLAPRRRRPPKDVTRMKEHGTPEPLPKERPRPVRRTSLDRMPELKS